MAGLPVGNEGEPAYFEPLPERAVTHSEKTQQSWSWIEAQLKVTHTTGRKHMITFNDKGTKPNVTKQASTAKYILVAGHYPVR